MSKETPDSPAREQAPRHVTIELDEFAWSALVEEADAMSLSVEALGAFALLYYLADRDSGRVARRISSQRIGEGRGRITGPDLRVR